MRLTSPVIKQLIKEELRRFLLQEQEGSAEYSFYDSASKDDLESPRVYTESELNAMNTRRLDKLVRDQKSVLRALKKKERKAFKRAGVPQEIRDNCKDWIGKTPRARDRTTANRPEDCQSEYSKYYMPVIRSRNRLINFIREREDGTRTFEPKKSRDLSRADQKILQRQAMGTAPCDAGDPAWPTPEIGKFAYKICMRSKGQRTEEDISSAAGAQRTLEAELFAFKKAGKKCNYADTSAPRCPKGSQCVNGECKKRPGWTGGVDCVQNCVDQGGDEERCKKACKKTAATGTEYEEEIHKANLKPNCEAGWPPGTVCTSFGAPRGQTKHCVKISVMQSTGAKAYKDKYIACLRKIRDKSREKAEVVLPTCDDGCPPGTICSKGKCVSLAGVDAAATPQNRKRCERKAGYFSRKARKLAATGVGAGPSATGTTGGVPSPPSSRTGSRTNRTGRGGAAHRRGLPNLQKEGFKSYADFYAALKAKGLMGELGPRGPDKKWGPYHRGAMKALKGMATTAAPAGSPEFNQRLAPEPLKPGQAGYVSPCGKKGLPEYGCGDSKGGYAPGVSRFGGGGTISWSQCVNAGKPGFPDCGKK